MFWLTILLFVLFLLLLIPASLKLYRQQEPQLAKAAAASCAGFSLLFLGILLFRLQVPYWTLLLTMATAFTSGFFGVYRRMYYRSILFDRYLHAYGTFSFALLWFYLLDHFLLMGGSRLFLAVFAFLLGNTLGAIFELLEFGHDRKPANTVKAQHGLKDTDMDLLFNLFGSLAAALVIYVMG